jgi:hypothetical protein
MVTVPQRKQQQPQLPQNTGTNKRENITGPNRLLGLVKEKCCDE